MTKWWIASLMVLLWAARAGLGQPQAFPVHYYVQLIWGTNREKPQSAQFRPVGPKLKTQLTHVFQWQRYWEVNRQEALLGKEKPVSVRLSPECEVQLEFVPPNTREARIYGKGILVTRLRQKLQCHQLAIHGASIETGGSWFVVIREDEPTAE